MNYQEKLQLRSHMKEVLKGVSEDVIKEASILACNNAIRHPAFQNAHTILCYQAMHNEADPTRIIEEAYKQNKHVAFPLCLANYRMAALEPETQDSFSISAYGIREPIPAQSREWLPEEIDLVIVPGLAFDSYGGRLGRGAGYYDRFLKNTDAHRMGFCLSAQLVERVPMGRFDCYMHSLITNFRTFQSFMEP